METVVDVGRPNELKVSSSNTSVTMTAKKITMISPNVNICGLKTPLRAISIMPLENVAPTRTPKLTASLLTPTNRSNAASNARNNRMTTKN